MREGDTERRANKSCLIQSKDNDETTRYSRNDLTLYRDILTDLTPYIQCWSNFTPYLLISKRYILDTGIHPDEKVNQIVFEVEALTKAM